MTKEQRAQSRAICEATEIGNGIISVNISEHALAIYRNARTTLPAALDALDEAEDEIKIKQRTIDALIAELKRTEARAEALEGAAYGVCEFCVYENESVEDANSPCFEYGAISRSGYFPKCEHWQFDEARFREGD